MTLRINVSSMTLENGDRVVATALYSDHATADGNATWIVSTHPDRVVSRNQAITALTLAERLAVRRIGATPSS